MVWCIPVKKQEKKDGKLRVIHLLHVVPNKNCALRVHIYEVHSLVHQQAR